jgi:hypothetical protein
LGGAKKYAVDQKVCCSPTKKPPFRAIFYAVIARKAAPAKALARLKVLKVLSSKEQQHACCFLRERTPEPLKSKNPARSRVGACFIGKIM